MRTVKEIKAEIKETRAEMKARGIKKTSCFNGGLDRTAYAYNSTLFRLAVELEKAEKAEKAEQSEAVEAYWIGRSESLPPIVWPS